MPDEQDIILAKTVWCDPEGRLWSWSAAPKFSPRLHRDWWVEYLPGEWVSGRAPLFIREIPLWQTNVQHRPERQVWAVEAEGVRAVGKVAAIISNTRSLRLFWALGGAVLSGVASTPTTASCRIADRIRLIEQLPRASDGMEGRYYDRVS